jgi:hypothetical protein
VIAAALAEYQRSQCQQRAARSRSISRGEFRLYPRTKGQPRNRLVRRAAKAGAKPQRGHERTRQRGALRSITLYVEKHGGVPICPTCGQPIPQDGERVSVMIANYLETKPATDAVHPAPRPHPQLPGGHRAARGHLRPGRRGMGAGVPRLACRAAGPRPGAEHDREQPDPACRGDAFGGVEPGFKTIPTTELNRTPQHRSDIAELAAMFRYCLEPKARTDKEARRRRERENLLRFLRASVATWARPDAVLDISTDPKRHQWQRRPGCSRSTPRPPPDPQAPGHRADRAPVRAASRRDQGLLHPGRQREVGMGIDGGRAGLPGDGESGMKLIRRSVSTIARKRLGEEHWVQGKIMLGHQKADDQRPLCASRSGQSRAARWRSRRPLSTRSSAACPGAFYRDLTAIGGNVASIARGLKP